MVPQSNVGERKNKIFIAFLTTQYPLPSTLLPWPLELLQRKYGIVLATGSDMKIATGEPVQMLVPRDGALL